MEDAQNGAAAGRLLALDVFRGLTIAGMVLVNNPGSWAHVYSPLRHAPWHGWTPTDLIFPFFLFIVGVSMSFSLGRRLEQGVSPRVLYPKIIRRTLILFGLGLFLHLIPASAAPDYNWFRDTLQQVRIMGVLQRIALVYCFASLIVLHTSRRMQVVWAAGLLVFYWLAMKYVPFTVVQDGVAVIYRGSLQEEFNLAAYVDNLLLRGHTYQAGRYLHYDPEGLLSTVPAVATALFGVFTGHWLRSEKSQLEKVSGLFFAGMCGFVLGGFLGLGFPINKPLWSPSYAVFTAGLAALVLASCLYLIDVKRVVAWSKPFMIFGMNPIVLYVLSEATARLMMAVPVTAGNLKAWLYTNLFAAWFGEQNGSLMFAVCYVLSWLAAMTVLYRRRIFIKI